MNRVDAARLARQLMNQHGLDKWVFQWDGARRRFGVCKHRRCIIGLSEHLVELNPEEAVRDTILHEIAHALAGGAAGHGPLWRQKCREIGANPERCYDSNEVVAPEPPFVLVCPNCGPVAKVHRRSHKKTACFHCCRTQSRGRFDPRFLLTYRLNPKRARDPRISAYNTFLPEVTE